MRDFPTAKSFFLLFIFLFLFFLCFLLLFSLFFLFVFSLFFFFFSLLKMSGYAYKDALRFHMRCVPSIPQQLWFKVCDSQIEKLRAQYTSLKRHASCEFSRHHEAGGSPYM